MEEAYNLRLARRDTGLSQKAAAKLIGATLSEWKDWENHYRIMPDDYFSLWKDQLSKMTMEGLNYIAIMRVRAGLTVEEAARLTMVTKYHFTKWERGYKPMPHSKWEILTAFVAYIEDYKEKQAANNSEAQNGQ